MKEDPKCSNKFCYLLCKKKKKVPQGVKGHVSLPNKGKSSWSSRAPGWQRDATCPVVEAFFLLFIRSVSSIEFFFSPPQEKTKGAADSYSAPSLHVCQMAVGRRAGRERGRGLQTPRPGHSANQVQLISSCKRSGAGIGVNDLLWSRRGRALPGIT